MVRGGARSTLILASVLLAAAVFGACDDTEKQALATYARIRDQKADVEKQAAVRPLRMPQHTAFKAYFAGLNDQAQRLWTDVEYREAFFDQLRKRGFSPLCRELFVAEKQWRELMTACRETGYFVCADELEAYPGVLRSFLMVLPNGLQKGFLTTEGCPWRLAR